MKILFITHLPLNSHPKTQYFQYFNELDYFEHEIVWLYYGNATLGYRPDVVILLEPPLNEREEMWLGVAKHRWRPGTPFINPKAQVTEAYAENANDY